MRVLNLYAGIGGNRKHWDADVTAVEHDAKVAEVYGQLHPNDEVVVGDAHAYLLDHFAEFDFIWSSPPCPTHSRMILSGKNRTPRYPDMRLYEEVIFLQHHFNGKWVVENVVPYYDPLIPARQLGRHLFWANFHIGSFEPPKQPADFIKTQDRQILMDWLGIHFEGNLYLGGNHCPLQVFRNCVHPDLGQHVFECAEARDLFGEIA